MRFTLSAYLFIKGFELMDVPVYIESFKHDAAAFCSHLSAKHRVLEEPPDRCGQGWRICGLNQYPGPALGDHFGYGCDSCGHTGLLHSHGFNQG
jgi:hypothetical protein